MRVVTSTYARNNFEEIVSTASYGKEPVVVTRRNEPVVVIQPFHQTPDVNTSTQGIKPVLKFTKPITKRQAQAMFRQMKESYDQSLFRQ